ncbi:FmdE, Molybdenum formylmethanofuran dehydrogenase operon [Pelotomaculum schinkii]|uniref:FmdE, Molybdenum formylmethanofuran dehydrogenase operon n=1 Tax=Pelotomaculum schinkii TaxID=78350 RepID=A0A4Y7RGI3_9FIRM|nr:FmdE, Molybdenum formylmethanofuran dehydrogenase operon [Pelotomaculum schinkii]
MMSVEKNDWEKSVEFHGHSCPGLAIGYRVSKAALGELAAVRAIDEELVAIVENDACGVDAVQALTGCSLGKGNLLYRDHGKQVYTFVCRDSGRAARIAVRASAWRNHPGHKELRIKYFRGVASPEEREAFRQIQRERTERILEMPAEELYEVRQVEVELPPLARVFDTLICAECGEPVMEPRARLQEGRVVCLPCAGQYTRGW